MKKKILSGALALGVALGGNVANGMGRTPSLFNKKYVNSSAERKVVPRTVVNNYSLVKGANPLYSEKEMAGMTLHDGISTSNMVHTINLDKDSRVDLSQLSYGGKLTVVDTERAVEGCMRYAIKDPDNKYSSKRQGFVAGNYSDLIERVKSEKVSDKEIKLLRKALEDRVIDPVEDGLVKDGKWQIQEDVVYALVAHGVRKGLKGEIGKKGSRFSVPSYVSFNLEKDNLLDEIFKVDHGVHLVSNVYGNKDMFGTSLGVQYNPVKGIGVGVLGNYINGSDKNVKKINEVSTNAGISFNGKIDEVNAYAFGISGELNFNLPCSEKWDIILGIGGGANKWNWVEKSEAKILKNGNIVESDTTSIPKTKWYNQVYGKAGVKYKDFSLSGIFGKEGRTGLFGGASVTYRLNSHGKGRK